MTQEKTIQKIKEIFEAGKTEIDFSEISDCLSFLKKSKVRFALLMEHQIVIDVDEGNNKVYISSSENNGPSFVNNSEIKTETKKPEPKPEVKKIQKGEKHSYVMPSEHKLIKKMVSDPSSLIVSLVGPTGSGKTHYTKLLAEELNMEHYHITCRKDMDSSSFFGDKTVDVDEKSGQNYIKFLEGPVVKAMKTGLDENGNEVGNPALLVIDEFPIIPSWLGVGLNNLMDSFTNKRNLMIDADGGRNVTSHSGFRIMLLGNTIGRGLTGFGDSLYAAQGDALDISTLDRIDAIFQFGYNRKAEENILRQKIDNDAIVNDVLKFRDVIRKHKRNEPHTMQTPFSTRSIVTIADLYGVWEDITEAMWYGIMSKLPKESADPRDLSGEIAIYNETAMMVFGRDIHGEKTRNSEYDF